MKYFTEGLWRDASSVRESVARKANRMWARNMKAYEAQLDGLLPAMGKRNQRFWSEYVYCLHDGRVARISVGDAVAAEPLRDRTRTLRSAAVIEIVGWDGFLYTLKYKSIEAVDMRLRHGECSLEGTLFDDWGYSELTPEGGGLLRHSILFATGSEMSIVFGRFSYVRVKLAKT